MCINNKAKVCSNNGSFHVTLYSPPSSGTVGPDIQLQGRNSRYDIIQLI